MTPTGASSTLRHRLVHRRDLIRELLVRDMKLRYKRSYLGVAWTLVNPLAQLLVYNFVFGVLFHDQTPNYLVFIFVGITCWTWFQGAVLESAVAILQNKDLIRQPGFPAALLPNVSVGTHMVHFILTFPILAALLMVNDIPLTTAVAWLPVVMLVQYLLTLAFGLLAACVHVNFRDTQYLLGIFLMLGFFLTPILYDISRVPEQYRVFYRLNPITQLVSGYRAILIDGDSPDLAGLGLVALVSLVLLALFYLLFRRASTGFVEEF